MSLALDCSAAAAWCFADERTPAIIGVMLRVREDGASVPSLWRLELANTLRSGIARGRITPAQRDLLMIEFQAAAIDVDPETDDRTWPDIVRLADRHQLTIYDASYLELACRRDLPLATLDKDLRKAALREGVPLLGQ